MTTMQGITMGFFYVERIFKTYHHTTVRLKLQYCPVSPAKFLQSVLVFHFPIFSLSFGLASIFHSGPCLFLSLNSSFLIFFIVLSVFNEIPYPCCLVLVATERIFLHFTLSKFCTYSGSIKFITKMIYCMCLYAQMYLT